MKKSQRPLGRLLRNHWRCFQDGTIGKNEGVCDWILVWIPEEYPGNICDESSGGTIKKISEKISEQNSEEISERIPRRFYSRIPRHETLVKRKTITTFEKDKLKMKNNSKKTYTLLQCWALEIGLSVWR